jgi:hypothetical protein
VAMKALLKWVIAPLSVAVLATGAASAASTTDYSDQWWAAAEPGWGASVQQQSNTLFVNLMVYGSDGQPTWFVAAAALQPAGANGHDVFAGDLYTATSASKADSPPAAARKVGTLVFDASDSSHAALSYSVDGTPVVKNVTRETWSQDNLDGTYDGFWWNRVCYSLDWEPANLVVRHDADNNVTIKLTCPYCMTNFSHELRGTYVQDGHHGRIEAQLVAPDAGSITIFEIERTAVGFMARFRGDITSSGETCQVTDGQVGAVRLQ